MSNKAKQIDEKIDALKKQKSFLEKRARYASSKNERKVRARRLIETGALAEKYFELENLTISEREEIFKMFSKFIVSSKPSKYKKQPF